MTTLEMRVNIYNNSTIGHANVSFYSNGDHQFTLGANILLETPKLGLPQTLPSVPDDGIYLDESAYHLAEVAAGTVTWASVPLDEAAYADLLNQARSLENTTYNYSVLTEACVDLVAEFYEMSGHPGEFGDLFAAEDRHGSLVWSRVPSSLNPQLGLWPEDSPLYVPPKDGVPGVLDLPDPLTFSYLSSPNPHPSHKKAPPFFEAQKPEPELKPTDQEGEASKGGYGLNSDGRSLLPSAPWKDWSPDADRLNENDQFAHKPAAAALETTEYLDGQDELKEADWHVNVSDKDLGHGLETAPRPVEFEKDEPNFLWTEAPNDTRRADHREPVLKPDATHRQSGRDDKTVFETKKAQVSTLETDQTKQKDIQRELTFSMVEDHFEFKDDEQPEMSTDVPRDEHFEAKSQSREPTYSDFDRSPGSVTQDTYEPTDWFSPF
ncbi:hypothetical protein V8J82_19770 [Gymnodinialimonas sp. 2305UL16-5]|uniref:hypothetical protein n=1 Tax=Gymnodinialimonas mytili TaxID=3126503 RepID=UPI0030A29A12